MSLVDDIAGRVSRVRVETSFLPLIELDHPFSPGPPSPLLQALRPKITVEFENDVFKPVVMAPYGEPDPGAWEALKAAAVVTGLAAALVASLYIRRRLRRRGR
jgi:hypothetical protein